MDYLFAPDRTDTPTFTIRSYEPGDGPLLADAVNTSYEHLHPFMPWAQPHTPPEEAEQRCRRFRAQYLLAENFVMGIFSPAGDRQVGGCGYHLRGMLLAQHTADIGIWIRADAAGQGLGTAALLTLLRWGFSAWPWVRLTWHCDTRNVASARTAARAGMLKEGCLRSDDYVDDVGTRRDSFVFAALRDEWGPPA